MPTTSQKHAQPHLMQTEFDQLSRERPREIVTESADRGEIEILSVSRGKTNGEWVCEVWYSKGQQ